MNTRVEELPSGKKVARTFGDDGKLLEETHTHGTIEIGCTITYRGGAKIDEIYFVKSRLVKRARYEKERVKYPDMPAPDASLVDTGAEIAKAARKEQRQRADANKRRRANPLTEEQKQVQARMMPLFQASDNNLEAMRALLDDGADSNWRAIVSGSERGHTPLYNACFSDSAQVVRLLLERGADPNTRFEYHSPIDGRVERELTAVMFARSSEVAGLLIEAGGDVNVSDANGTTPLMRAAHRGNCDVARILLEAGASPELRNAGGHSAFDLAKDKIEFFEANRAGFKEGHVDKRVKEYEETLQLLKRHGV